MNLIRFFLVDLALIFSGFLFLLVFQSNKSKFSSSENSNDSRIPDESLREIPDLKEILEMETISVRKGSGIEIANLIGLWKFVSVWRKGTDRDNKLLSSLLRLFSASLELVKKEVNGDLLRFEIINSIEFGLLSIRFEGCGELKGSQPLLMFYFEEIQLKIGKDRLIRKSINIPDETKRPFFSLIGRGRDIEWLAARGRGGGVAIWLKA